MSGSAEEIMNISHYYRLCLVAICLIAWGYGSSSIYAQDKVLHAQTPQLQADYGKGVSGHIAWSDNGKLLMAGGCNFPDKPAREGGTKRYYSDIYLADFSQAFKSKKGKNLDLEWKRIGSLPHPTAYAAFAPYYGVRGNALIVAGGKSEQGDLSDVYALSLTQSNTLRHVKLPSLPAPRSGMGSAIMGERLYLIGGTVSGKLSNSVISLDLNNVSSGWREETPYPHSPFLKIVAGTDYPNVVCVGSFTGINDPVQEVRADVTYMSYKPDTRQWSLYPAQGDKALRGVSFGGGYKTHHASVFSGGVDASIFVPALQREKDLKQAIEEGDSLKVVRLQQASRAYLSHKPSWYRFNGHRYSFNPIRRAWMRVEDKSLPGRADAVFLTIQEGVDWDFNLLIGGETMPGVRTSSIWIQAKKLNYNIRVYDTRRH